MSRDVLFACASVSQRTKASITITMNNFLDNYFCSRFNLQLHDLFSCEFIYVTISWTMAHRMTPSKLPNHFAPLGLFCSCFFLLTACTGRLPRLATSLAFYRSQKGLSLKNSEKSPKRGSRGLSAPGSKKPEKDSKMTIFQFFFRVFGTFSTFFSTFFELLQPRGREAPGTPFRTFFGVF